MVCARPTSPDCWPPPDQLRASPSQQNLVEPLTERELEVLRLIAKGLTYEEVAEQLVVSLRGTSPADGRPAIFGRLTTCQILSNPRYYRSGVRSGKTPGLFDPGV